MNTERARRRRPHRPPRERTPRDREPKPRKPKPPPDGSGNAADYVRCGRQQIGKPYVWATAGPNTFDCCLAGDTLVAGPDAVRRMDELSAGDSVWSWEDGYFWPQRVVATRPSGSRPVYRLRTQGRSILATENHPFLVVGSAGYRVAAQGGGNPGTAHDFTWRRLDDLHRGDRIVVMTRDDTKISPAEDTDFPWLLGLIVGDGHVRLGKQPQLRICVYGEARDRAASIINRLSGCSSTYGESYGLATSAAALSRGLLEMGIGVPSYEKRVPPVVWTWPDNAQRAFLDGYCEADGHRPSNQGRHGERTYASSSPDLIAEVRMLHLLLGDAVGNISIHQRTKPIVIKGVVVKHARPMFSFAVWRGRRDTGAGLKSGHRDIYRRIEETGKTWSVRSILGIDLVGEEETYDIEVSGPGNFVANGIVVHNSGLTSYCYQEVTGKPMTRSSYEQAKVGKPVERKDVRDGDLLGWDTGSGPWSHVGIATEGGKSMVNALNEHLGIQESDLSSDYWRNQVRFSGARRLDFPTKTKSSPVAPAKPAKGRLVPYGAVQTVGPGNGWPVGQPWENAERYRDEVEHGADRYDLKPSWLIAIGMIETGCTQFRPGGEVVIRPADDYDDVAAIGLMQVKVGFHQGLCPSCDADTVAGNILLGAAVLRQGMDRHGGDLIGGLTGEGGYFPGDDSQSGFSNSGYAACFEHLVREIEAVQAPAEGDTERGKRYSIPGLANDISLPFPLELRIIQSWQTNQRPGIPMHPDRFVQHDTGNRQPGANADQTAQFLWDGAPHWETGELQELGYHAAIDDHKVIILLPFNEVAWHGGDQDGPCNMRGLACELAIYEGIDVERSREHAAIFAAEVMNAAAIESLKPHQACAGKFCPEDMLEDNAWEPWFVGRVSHYRQERRNA